jgi:hypothetical protein
MNSALTDSIHVEILKLRTALKDFDNFVRELEKLDFSIVPDKDNPESKQP